MMKWFASRNHYSNSLTEIGGSHKVVDTVLPGYLISSNKPGVGKVYTFIPGSWFDGE
jgi:hypothetical protein